MKMASLQIVHVLPGAIAGTDDSQENPLARALAPLMKMHKQLPSIRLVFLAEGENALPTRWLGVFAKSPGDRVLFFPGLDVDLLRVRGTDSGVTVFDKEFDLDHISLEKNHDTWHITSPYSKVHQGGPGTMEVGNGCVFWFGMALCNLAVLRIAKEQTIAKYEVADKATQYKLTEFQKAIEGGVNVKMPFPSPLPDGKRFPMLAVVIGPKDAPFYNGKVWVPPYGSPYVTGGPSPENNLVTRGLHGQVFPLDDTMDVQLRATWIPGEMAIPMILTSPKNEG